MRNPWLDLPASAPFVLTANAAVIARFNERARADVAVHIELLPEPLLGDPLSPIVLLRIRGTMLAFRHHTSKVAQAGTLMESVDGRLMVAPFGYRPKSQAWQTTTRNAIRRRTS